jgi:3-oxoacyl-[acyl-carrier-protein] synthase-3
MSKVFIAGAGYHHPPERVTNADLEKLVATTDAWILERTGVAERRRAAPDVLTSDMGVLATRGALEAAGIGPRDLDLLVCATSSPDTMLPPAACHIAHKLGIDPVAFDVNAACAGFTYALAVSKSLMDAMGHRCVALCAADRYTTFVDYGDRRTCILFGDAAATIVLRREPPRRGGAEVVDVHLENWHAGIDLVRVPVGGYWHLESGTVNPAAGEIMWRAAQLLLDRHGLRASDLRAFIGHQANYRLLEEIAKRLGVVPEQHWSNVQTMGNQGAAGVLASYAAGVEEHAETLRDGDWILMTVVGAGCTGGSALLRWTRG